MPRPSRDLQDALRNKVIAGVLGGLEEVVDGSLVVDVLRGDVAIGASSICDNRRRLPSILDTSGSSFFLGGNRDNPGSSQAS